MCLPTVKPVHINAIHIYLVDSVGEVKTQRSEKRNNIFMANIKMFVVPYNSVSMSVLT